MNQNWLVNRTNPEFIKFLSDKASISKIFAQVLVNRGMKDVESIKEFISPSIENMHDPFLMPDMRKAVDRINDAVKNKETVLIHGDYDADGITSTAVLMTAFKRLGLKAIYHIPNRITEGYGISRLGIEKAKASGAGLIITVDCGVSADGEIAAALAMGLDVIVTDHHEPPEKLPEALAVIDPHRADSEYPFKYLAGVGVAFKLVQALAQDRGIPVRGSWVGELLDLVALGTIADSVPLTGENRLLVVGGLEIINAGPSRPGIQAMKNIVRIDGDVRAGQLSFTLIPRINAAGRINDAGEAVELFLTDDDTKAGTIARLLDEQNRKRQKIEGEVLSSALEMIDPAKPDNAIVLSSPDWHPGVIGIVASRLIALYNRPVFLFSVKDNIAKGSARGISAFHLYNAIAECADMLTGFGGHRQAAGLSLDVKNLPAFREKMNLIVDRTLSEDDFVPTLAIDAAVKLSEINYNLVDELSLLEPFGQENPEPVLGSKSLEVVDRRIVGNNHLKMMLKQESTNLNTIGFKMGDKFADINSAPSLDAAYVPGINEWNGTRSIQLNLKAIRPGS